MTYFHTSPAAITSINEIGRFGSFLFFSARQYAMSASGVVCYSIELDDSGIIDAGSLFYSENAAALDSLVAEFCERFNVDHDDAEEIISERKQLDCDAEDSWEVQLFTARAARALGFRAVRVSDEQGSSLMVDMLGRESEFALAVE